MYSTEALAVTKKASTGLNLIGGTTEGKCCCFVFVVLLLLLFVCCCIRKVEGDDEPRSMVIGNENVFAISSRILTSCMY